MVQLGHGHSLRQEALNLIQVGHQLGAQPFDGHTLSPQHALLHCCEGALTQLAALKFRRSAAVSKLDRSMWGLMQTTCRRVSISFACSRSAAEHAVQQRVLCIESDF